MIKEYRPKRYLATPDEFKIVNPSARHPRSICPVCSATRQHPRDPSVEVHKDGGTAYCWHCGAWFKISDRAEDTLYRAAMHYDAMRRGVQGMRRRKEPQEVKPWVPPRDLTAGIGQLDDVCRQYLRARGISEATATAAGVGCRVTQQRGVPKHWLAFIYYDGTVAHNVQYKLADTADKRFTCEEGGHMIPWNINSVAQAHGEVLYITEGMMDALALMECGVKCVVSVSNGAKSRLETFDAYRAMIDSNVSEIVFAGDTDREGVALRTRIKEYFDMPGMRHVTWHCGTSDAKDADEMLMKEGADAVRHCLDAAAPDTECKGVCVMHSDCKALDEIYRNGIADGMTIGLEGFDDIVHFKPGYMYVVTGYPGAGKSSLVNYITMRLLVRYGWRTLFFSPEKMPVENHYTELIQVLTGRSFGHSAITQHQYEAAKRFLDGNVMHISSDEDSIDSIMRMAAVAECVHGIRVLVIDPFVYLSLPDVPGMSDTQKISELLKTIIRQTRKIGIVTILVAHPRKPSGEGLLPAQMLYEIAGSAHFYNLCDSGIIVERKDITRNNVTITCGKARHPSLGHTGSVSVLYDSFSSRYSVPPRNGAQPSADTTVWCTDACADEKNIFGREDIPEEEMPF